MASHTALMRLVASTWPAHTATKNQKSTDQQTQDIKSSIDAILAIVAGQSWSPQELEIHLWMISTFFREQKFTTVILPVLENIAKEDFDTWKNAKQWDTKMPLIPQSFENIDKNFSNARELALLKVYWITIDIISRTQRVLAKNQAQQ